MGQTALGGTQMGPNAQLLTPEQQNYLSQALGNAAPQAGNAYSQFLQPQGMEDYQSLFEQSYIKPAQQALQRNIIPTIQQSFVDENAGSSTALNRALAEAATDVTTNLGQQFGNFYQNQQNLQQQGSLGALGQLGGLAGQRAFEPTTITQQGWLGPVLNALATVLGSSIPKFG